MNRHRIDEYLTLLKSEITPALGCTEPAAVALAVAYAAKELDHPATGARVAVSQYILKNAMNVGIPGTGMIGLDIAVALGSVSAQPDKQLMVLTGLTDDQKEYAKQLVANKAVIIALAQTKEKVYVEAEVTDGKNTAKAIISGTHTHLVWLQKNGVTLFESDTQSANVQQNTREPEAPYTVSLKEIFEFVSEVPTDEIGFMADVIELNRSIAKEGLTNDYGLKVGKSILNNDKTGLISGDIGNYAVALTAAAADARMAGCDKPVMSAAGSGNQGLTATLPVAAISWKLGMPDAKTYRALALSILVTIHTKHNIGRLSVLCGCSIAAAIGTCCGVIFLFDGTLENIYAGINSMVADISGVVCDGAKPGCALKIATAVNSAIRSASMALNGVGAGSNDGIVNMDAEKTLGNLGKLGNEGMGGTNAAILEMMLCKQ